MNVDVENAYFSGLLDGEASYTIKRYNHCKSIPAVSMSMTDFGAIQDYKKWLDKNDIPFSYCEWQPKYIKKNGELASRQYRVDVYGFDRCRKIKDLVVKTSVILTRKMEESILPI